MNSRERILAAVNHKEPDRIPVDLGATPSSGISSVAYANLLKYMNLDLPNNVYDVIQQVAQPDDLILDRFGVDAVDLGRFFTERDEYWHELELVPGYKAGYPRWFTPERSQDGEWFARGKTGKVIGRMPVGATFFDQTIYPYAEAFPTSFENIGDDMSLAIWGGLGLSPWDSNTGDDFWQRLREKAIEARQRSDRAIILGIGCNLFEWGCFLRRMDNFMMDLFINPKESHAMLDALMDKHMYNLTKACEAVGDVVDIIKFGDDLGMNGGPFMSDETYREFFAPRHKILCDYVRAHSGMVTMIHSCGSIENLIPDMIDAGFQIFNPIQINALNMDPLHLKREFGKDITFWGGGCDTQSVLNNGTVEQVKDHVRRNVEVFAKGGGFVFNTVHNIMPDVPPENIVAMFDTLKEF